MTSKKSDMLTIIINEAPYGNERSWNALRLALTSKAASIRLQVNIFLVGDGVSVEKKGQNPPSGYYNLEKMINDFIIKGGKVRACGICLKARGLNQKSIIKGVEVGTMMGLTNWVKESKTTLSF
jgi:sulfur relay (sulfurtransferase) complex TusBCD TusD component (DsrE family)